MWVLFVASVACGLASVVPQFVRGFRTRDTRSLSLVFIVLLLTTFALRTVNAAMYKEVANIVLLVLLAALYLILLGLKVRYSYSGDDAEDPGERW